MATGAAAGAGALCFDGLVGFGGFSCFSRCGFDGGTAGAAGVAGRTSGGLEGDAGTAGVACPFECPFALPCFACFLTRTEGPAASPASGGAAVGVDPPPGAEATGGLTTTGSGSCIGGGGCDPGPGFGWGLPVGGKLGPVTGAGCAGEPEGTGGKAGRNGVDTD